MLKDNTPTELMKQEEETLGKITAGSVEGFHPKCKLAFTRRVKIEPVDDRIEDLYRCNLCHQLVSESFYSACNEEGFCQHVLC